MRNENRLRKRRRVPVPAIVEAPRERDDELIFVCPDRDETGFTPSSR